MALVSVEDIVQYCCDRHLVMHLWMDDFADACSSRPPTARYDNARIEYLEPFLTHARALRVPSTPPSACPGGGDALACVLHWVLAADKDEAMCEAWAAFLQNIAEEKQQRHDSTRTFLHKCGQM
jgi:hypothetical protein